MEHLFPKYLTPKSLSISIGLLSLVMPITMLYMALYMHQVEKEVFLIFSLLSIFSVNYVVIVYVLNRFIIKRISPIYGKIDEVENLDDGNLNFDDRDIIGDLDRKVIEWAKKKDQENKRLRKNDTVRKEFIGNVAHELKTPIFNIQGYIDTLLDGGIDDPDINVKYLERTEKNVLRLIATIKDIDTISRLESGKVMLDFCDFDLLEVLRDIIDMQDRLTKKFSIKILFENKCEGDVYILGDRDKIYEALHNLISNSIKYGREGGKTFVTVFGDGKKIWVTVQDNGIGISEDHLPHIFSRFYRVDKSRSRDRGGSGLGLSIVKHIIEAHGELITVESKLGEGTKFTLSLCEGESI